MFYDHLAADELLAESPAMFPRSMPQGMLPGTGPMATLVLPPHRLSYLSHVASVVRAPIMPEMHPPTVPGIRPTLLIRPLIRKQLAYPTTRQLQADLMILSMLFPPSFLSVARQSLIKAASPL